MAELLLLYVHLVTLVVKSFSFRNTQTATAVFKSFHYGEWEHLHAFLPFLQRETAFLIFCLLFWWENHSEKGYYFEWKEFALRGANFPVKK